MTLAAEAPDLDVLWGFKGPVSNFAHHRGFTHSFLGLFIVCAVVVAFMYLVWLMRGKKTNIPDLPPRWGLLFVFAYIAGISHILLDFTNNYGVRPFWPFWEKWYSWDIVFIFEPALYIFLISGLILPALFSRDQPLPRGRKAAALALLAVVALWAFRDHEHRHALSELRMQRFQTAVLLEPDPLVCSRRNPKLFRDLRHELAYRGIKSSRAGVNSQATRNSGNARRQTLLRRTRVSELGTVSSGNGNR